MESKHPSITLTGIDERTDLDLVAKLDAEIGILHTATPEGRNRYPRREWIEEATSHLTRVAIHVCGSSARHALCSGDLDVLVSKAQRIQVNGVFSVLELERILNIYPGKTIITQHVVHRPGLNDLNAANHALLVDASGGRGLLPSTWRRPGVRNEVGFAGGLGPDNLAHELPKIAAVATGRWWVDMEGRIRTPDDWFSIELARAAVETFSKWREDFLLTRPLVCRISPA